MFKKSLVLLAATSLCLIAASCGSGSGSDDDEETATAQSSSVEEAPDVDQSTSALTGDRNNPDFPPALIPINEITSGGPPPDGIPPIDAPVFAAIDDIDFLDDSEPIIAVEVNGEAKAYPTQILIWHEIVNDEIGGEPVTVSYCPLCNSALAYNREVAGEILDFGTSGELFQSALVMYDRQTESLWTHFDGHAVVGTLAGTELDFVPAQTISWASFKDTYEDGLVLTTETGHDRSYGSNPYSGYDDPDSEPISSFFSADLDERERSKERVVGIELPDGPIAVARTDVSDAGAVTVDDNTVVFHEGGLASALDESVITDGADIGQIGVFERTLEDGTVLEFQRNGAFIKDTETGSTWSITGLAIDGELVGQRLEAVAHLDTFWFAWSTYQPGTKVFGQ